MKTLADAFEHTLQDIYYAENALTKALAKFTNQVHHFMEVARWERFTTSSIWTSVLNWIACEMQAIHFDELER